MLLINSGTPAHRVWFKPSIPHYRARAESERSLMRRCAHECREVIGRDVGDWSALGALRILERVRLQVLGERPNACVVPLELRPVAS